MVTSANKKISVIIPNLNGRDFLDVCLESLILQTFGDFEVILVDNASTDDSLALARKKFPQIVIHEFKENQGFSRAINQGLSLAKGEYIFLLNNDTELAPDCLWQINDFFDRRPDVSIAAAKMLFLDDRQRMNGAGDDFSIYGLASQRGRGELDHGQYDEAEAVFGACAGAAAYRRDIFKEVGLFDENFFAYLEDVDLSFRAQMKGYKCFYLPSAVVYHFDGGTSKRTLNLSRFLILRNSLYVILKDLPWQLLLVLSPFLVLSQIRNVLIGLKHHCPLLILRVYSDFLRHCPILWRERLKIQRGRSVSLKYLLGLMSKKYPFSIKESFYGFFGHHR